MAAIISGSPTSTWQWLQLSQRALLLLGYDGKAVCSKHHYQIKKGVLTIVEGKKAGNGPN